MTDARGARIVRLLEDPAVGDDVLLVGLALAAKYDFAFDYGGNISGMADRLWPDSDMRLYRIKSAFKKDIRTYRPPTLEWKCSAPMVRRSGICGKNATTKGYITDWATGEMTAAGGCSRHAGWFSTLHRANWRAKPENPPLPYANHGGALRVHFPAINWPAFWRRLDPRWVEHPEGIVWPKPTLRLVLGDGDDDTDSARPLLSAVALRPQESP